MCGRNWDLGELWSRSLFPFVSCNTTFEKAEVPARILLAESCVGFHLRSWAGGQC